MADQTKKALILNIFYFQVKKLDGLDQGNRIWDLDFSYYTQNDLEGFQVSGFGCQECLF